MIRATWTAVDRTVITESFEAPWEAGQFIRKWAGGDAECHNKTAYSTDNVGYVTVTGDHTAQELLNMTGDPNRDSEEPWGIGF